VARAGITERWVPLDHDRHFKESNLRAISDSIMEWCGAGASKDKTPEEVLVHA
jgi:hypothetical protein